MGFDIVVRETRTLGTSRLVIVARETIELGMSRLMMVESMDELWTRVGLAALKSIGVV